MIKSTKTFFIAAAIIAVVASFALIQSPKTLHAQQPPKDPNQIDPPAEPTENQPQPDTTEETSDDQAQPQTNDASSNENDHDQLVPAMQPKLPPFYYKIETLLKKYVDTSGRVDYPALRRKRGDLLEITNEFETLFPGQVMAWSKDEKISFWINAYNIFTLKLIIENYPPKPRWYKMHMPYESIWHIPGAWTKKYFKTLGLEYTLNEIEREILIDRFNDMRVIFALTYATQSSPILLQNPYYPHKLDEQLNAQTKKYINSPDGMKIDSAEKIVYLSETFKRHEDSFISNYAKVKRFRDYPDADRAYLNFIYEHLTPSQKTKLESTKYTIKFMKYNWKLNDK